MNCCEDVIVTVRLHPGERSLDMELPAFLPMEQMEQRFLEVMREMDPLHYGGMSVVSFRKGDRVLAGDTTLAASGIWDGSFLDAYMSEEE